MHWDTFKGAMRAVLLGMTRTAEWWRRKGSRRRHRPSDPGDGRPQGAGAALAGVLGERDLV